MKWLFHVVREADLHWDEHGFYAPASLGREGFVHASYKDAVLESARLYFAPGEPLRVLVIDPRKLEARIEVAATPRGSMPHVHGPIPHAAVREIALADVAAHDDEIA